MDKKTVRLGLVVIAALLGIMWLGSLKQREGSSAASQVANAMSSLRASEAMYDFGTISMKNGLATHVFKVTNPTNQDIQVKKMHTSCMCTTAFFEGPTGEKGPFGMEGMGYTSEVNEIIKSKESKNIKVVYDPNAHGPAGIGSIDRLVYLEDGSGANLTLEIKAVVTP